MASYRPHFPYWILPLISGVMWLATLLALLIYWIVDTHRVKYPSMQDDQTIAYISDVGAATLKPLFVAGCIITTIFLDLSFGADRWLRHRGRLVPNISMTEKVLSGLTIFFAFVGTVGLTCLSGFDTAHYHDLHDIFLLLFIAGYLLSAVFICWEYQRLGIKYREHRVLRISFWIKLSFIIVEFCLAVAFAATNFLKHYNKAAIIEWVIAFVFSFYVFSFFVDLWPARYTANGRGFKTTGMNASDREMAEAERSNMDQPSPNGGVGSRYTEDSQRPLHNGRVGPHANF
ncbi:protein sfk1 [Apiospora arundinis]|uniref:Frag1/DRAM/Sfk1 family-domain-containing protein n=1 Tax=Apiospora arundinis TaxID=335852 RepID=A0ABR2I4W2_9PEZI